jgi:hypothetical protein
MKQIYSIFIVLFALFAISCTTDATSDSAILVEEGDQTTLTLSLEESRTQLGEKAGDLYPLYWSEGDKIAVNGIASTPLAAESDGSSTAVFNIDGREFMRSVAKYQNEFDKYNTRNARFSY